MSGANFNQILDELNQQKLQVEERITEATSKISQYTTDIEALQTKNVELQNQLEGLTQLENRTQLLQGNSNIGISVGS